MAYKISKSKKGFTLVELLMSMAIFVIITTLFVSATIILIDLSRRAEQTRATLDVLDFVITSMTKKARYGYNYNRANKTSDCITPSSTDLQARGFSVTVDEMSGAGLVPKTYTYWLNQDKKLMRSVDSKDYTLTPDDIKVERLCFYLTGETTGYLDGHPLLTFFVSGYTGKNMETGTSFNIQSSVSQRGTDY